MKKIIPYIGAYLLFLISPSLCAQENTFIAGFQYKPIFANDFFGTGPKTIVQNSIGFSIAQKRGYCGGMILRRGINKQFSLETGINFTKRIFALSITDTSFTGTSGFTIIGYEIPVQGMIFLRLTQKIYMSTSFGLSMDMYASNVYTQDTYFKHSSKFHSLFQFATLAGLGFEYRTEKNGYFFLGASYHLPFSYSYYSTINYLPKQEVGRIKLGGNYLALDFRYYFHEDPMKPKKKKKK